MTMWMINKEKFLKYKKKAAEYDELLRSKRALEEKIEYLELKLQNAKRGNK